MPPEYPPTRHNRFSHRVDWHYLLAWAVIIFAAIVLRVWQFPSQLLADDEWHALNKLQATSLTGIFTSFGMADHSIPLTLLYATLAKLHPLNEVAMRLPMLIAGCLTVIVAPWMLRHYLNKQELFWFGGLLCFSPILIYFSRTARPYAITTLLAFLAILFFFRWYRERQHRYGVAYVVFTTLCAWLQPITLSVLLAPFLFFGIHACYQSIRYRHVHHLIDLVILGSCLMVPLVALLLPPLLHDYASLSVKAGVDSVSISSLYISLQLLLGSTAGIYLATLTALALAGAWILFNRQALLCAYLVFISLISILLIIASQAAWIHHPLVTARYALPVLPLFLLLVAVGFGSLAGRLMKTSTRYLALVGVVVFSIVYAAGPLYRQYHAPINQFTGHMAYQFDYNWQRNIYNRALDNRAVSPFFQTLADDGPKRYHLVAAPWLMEWHWNRWYLDQAVHQQRISAGFLTGFCLENHYGEYPPGSRQVALTHIRHLSDLPPAGGGANAWEDVDFVVFYKTKPRPELDITIPASCLQQLRDIFGESYYEDGDLAVFRISSQ